MTFWAESHPKARTPHRCAMCRRAIEPGEVYRRSAGMDGSSAWTWIECAHCEAFVRFAFGRFWDYEYGEELLIDFDPSNVPEARVRAQYRRKWRRLDGMLYPVPLLTVREDRCGFGHYSAIVPGEVLTCL